MIEEKVLEDELLKLVSGGKLRDNALDEGTLEYIRFFKSVGQKKEDFIRDFRAVYKKYAYFRNEYSDNGSQEDLEEIIRFINEHWDLV